MTLSNLIQRGGLAEVATATPATVATHTPELSHKSRLSQSHTSAKTGTGLLQGSQVPIAGDGAEGIAGALTRAIDRARDWGDLNQICADNQAAFKAKLIDGDTSYHLAGLVLSRARVLPERAPLDEQVIPSEALYTRTTAKWGA